MAYHVQDCILLPPKETDSASYSISVASLGLSLVNDDWLIVCVACSHTVTGRTLSVSGTGWVEVAEVDVVSGSRMAVYKCKVAGGTAADPTFSITSPGTGMWQACIRHLRDADATDCVIGSLATDGGNVASFSTGAYTPSGTGSDNALILYFGTARNGGGGRPHGRFLSSVVVGDFMQVIYNAGGIGQSLFSGTVQQGAASLTAQTAYLANTMRCGSIVVAIKNKTGGGKERDCRAGIEKMVWMGPFGTAHEGLPATAGWGAPSTFCSGWPSGLINGIPVDTATTTLTVGTGVAYGPLATSLTSTLNTPDAWAGGWMPLPSTFNLTGKALSVEWMLSVITYYTGSQGVALALGDSELANTGNAVAFQLAPKSSIPIQESRTSVIYPQTAASIQTVGSIDWANIKKIGFFVHRTGSNANSTILYVQDVLLHTVSALVGGNASRPLDIRYLDKALNGWGYRGICERSGDAVMVRTPIQLGDGATPTYFDSTGTLLNMPAAYSAVSQPWTNIPANTLTVGAYMASGDTLKLQSSTMAAGQSQNLTFNAATSAGASYTFTGETFSKWNTTWATNAPVAGAVFTDCGTVAFKGADVTGVSVLNTTAGTTAAACSWDADGAVVASTTIAATTATGYHIELGSAVTAITLTNVTFSGTALTNKVHVLATTGTVTISIDGTTSLTAGQVTSAGAAISVVSAVAITFAGLVAGSKVKAFTTGTTTEVFGVTSSGTSEVWSGASGTFDYTVQQAGYKPIRVAGEVVSGSRTITIAQEVDRAYAASSGLTLGTNCYAAVGTKLFGLTVASTLQNFYCYMIEQWIALGDGGEAFANVTFPIQPNGPNSFSFLSGWEWNLATYSASIANLSRDGLRYVNPGGTTTAQWAAILASGVPAGARVRYRQADGGTTQQAVIASGNMDELVPVYGDAAHGNFDYRAYLALKVQEMGYDQAEADAVGLYGNLEDQLYVVGLAPTANTVATGNPALANPPTITDHGASPVTWQSKAWSLTITDSAAGNTGTGIMRWLRYYFETGGTFQGKDAFCWHDLVQQNGSSFKTVRGAVYGDTGAALKGVRVVRSDGTTPHADFNLMTADDGTAYQPPQQANITWASALDGTTVIVYNDSQAGYMLDGGSTVSGGGGYSLPITLPHAHVAAGDTIRLRHCKIDKYADEIVGTMTATGLALLGSQTTHEAYATWGINGAACDVANGGEFGANLTTIDINIESAGAVSYSLKKRIGAWSQYLLTLPAGLAAFYGAFTCEPAQIRQNVAVVDVVLRKNSAGNVAFTDRDVLYYRSDFSLPYDPTGNAIFMDYAYVPFTVSTGSGVTPTDKTDIAAAVRTNLSTELTLILDDAKSQGLVAGVPAVITATSRSAGSVSQTISEVGGTVTVARI